MQFLMFPIDMSDTEYYTSLQQTKFHDSRFWPTLEAWRINVDLNNFINDHLMTKSNDIITALT